jgi:NAD(P)H-hydrate repair Nnr-like enzyme with NAD(P)H-hydrate epimerase domain
MNEIAQLLQQRFGMSEDQALEAGRAVLQLVQSKIPEQYQGMLSSLMGSGEPGGDEQESGVVGSALGAVSGLFKRS